MSVVDNTSCSTQLYFKVMLYMLEEKCASLICQREMLCRLSIRRKQIQILKYMTLKYISQYVYEVCVR